MKRFLALLTAGVLATASALDIAQRGKPADCSIVIAENAAKPYVSAAKELQTFVEEMTGVKLPIVNDAAQLPAKAVLIGPNRHSKQLLKDEYKPKALGDDAYTMKVVGKRLVLLGNQRGGQYAVYDILERFAGCQWYSSWCSKIPKLDKFTVPDSLSITEKPAFMMREPFWFDMFNTMQAVRNRCNGNQMRLNADNGGKIAFGGGLFVHTFSKLVPPQEFFATHPEYFSEIGGKRMNGYYQLCLSNPDVKRIVIERMKKIIGESIKKDPSAKIFSLSQNDTRNPCACKECSKLLAKYGTQSGVMIWFVNQVAEEIEKDYPEALIETLAYQYTREPPKNIRPRSNVIPRLCTIECDFARGISESSDPQTSSFIKDIEGWASMTDKLFIWDYVTDFAHYIGPFPNFYSLQKNIQLFRDSHVVALMSQGAYQGYHADFAELKGWIGAKLMWNPDADVTPYLDDFFSKDGYYGAAGPFIRQYFNELHELVRDPKIYVKIWVPPTVKWITDDFLLRATDLFTQAEAAVKDDPVHLYNVRKASIPVYYARVERLPKEKIKYFWNGKSMTANASPLRMELTKELLTRFDEKLNDVDRPIKICESGQRHTAQYNSWADLIRGKQLSCVKQGNVSIGALPGINGMLALCQADGYKNLIDPENGGVSYLLNTRSASPSVQTSSDSNRIFTAAKAAADEIKLQNTLRNHSFSTIDYKLQNNGTINAAFTTRCDAPNGLPKVSPSAYFALKLGNETNVCYKVGNDQWKEFKGSQLFKSDMLTLNSSALNAADTITIAAPKTGFGATIKYNRERVRSLALRIIPANGSIVAIFREKEGINAKTTITSEYTLRFHTVTPLPQSIPYDKNMRHGIKIDATDIILLNDGDWCSLEKDKETSTGFAVNMAGTHHEWCLRSFMKDHDFDMGAKYNVRIRVKVEKAAPAGNAFSAGIYDTTAKKGAIKGVNLRIQDVKDGYQWYDMGVFTPHPVNDQWFWAAPGIFDKKNGAKSAVKNVAVDCVEFIPAE